MGVRLFRTAEDPFLKSLGLAFCVVMACVFVVNFFGDRWLYLSVNGYLWVMMACVARAQIIVDQGAVLKATEALPASNEDALIEEEPVYA
jgi:hypothetical protein